MDAGRKTMVFENFFSRALQKVSKKMFLGLKEYTSESVRNLFRLTIVICYKIVADFS